jgi:hypothetical protein
MKPPETQQLPKEGAYNLRLSSEQNGAVIYSAPARGVVLSEACRPYYMLLPADNYLPFCNTILHF